MPLKLMYITNSPDVALIAEAAGVDRIFVDMEYIGKAERQGGMDTVQSGHSLDDVTRIRETVTEADLLVRCNPIHDAGENYGTSEEEIHAIVQRGADMIMLPYFKTAEEVERFVKVVDGKARTMLLVETPEAVTAIDEILAVDGVDEVFIGLNDLSLGYGKKFMFELLADGTVERLCQKFREKSLPYGFGGIASLGKGLLPSEYVIREHYRLGSACAILSRSFCNTNVVTDLKQIQKIFTEGLAQIRELEKDCAQRPESWEENRKAVVDIVERIIG